MKISLPRRNSMNDIKDLKFGQLVTIDGKRKGQFIHYSKEGFATIDIDGMWNDYETYRIKPI